MSKIEQLLKKLCPNGVEYKKLGEVAHYSANRIDASCVNAKTYVGVESLLADRQGKVDSACVPVVGRLIEFLAGDVLIGNIRPYLKKIWLADCDGGTNGDVLAVQINDRAVLMPEYLYYVLSSDSFFLYDMQFAKGAKMPRGDKESILGYLIPVPPLEIQREVVEVLDKFALLTAELEKRKKQYEHYRRALLAEGNREQGIGNRCGVSNWPMVKLGEVCGSVSPSVKIKRLDYRETGLTPIVSQEIEYISGYCNLSDDKIPAGEYVCFGDHSEHIKYVNFAFVQGADGLKILKAKGGRVMAKFLYYVALAYYQRHDNYERHFKYFSETLVPLPPLAEQERIVKILDRFDKLCNDLTSGLPAEIAARKKQYEYYRDKLLSFKRAG